ncbi:glycosyltransferase family 39 protein [Candidatus Woesearchaeota archaeon]|nr:glycosyltransferase family 39 protein [Candidatus Woesearchaeota archaeon]
MQKKTAYWLTAIVLITFIARLAVALLVPNFTYDSYFTFRQVEHIGETGLPLFNDQLSYGGRELTFLPFFYYFSAFFDLFLPIEAVALLLPNLLLSLLPIIVFLISRKVSNSEESSLFAAFLTGFLPILFATANNFTNETLFIPLAFLTIYTFLKIDQPKYFYLFLGLFLACSLTSNATFLLVMGLIIYLLLSILENKRINRAELEVILFSSFLFIWTEFLFFKSLFAKEGIKFIWQNIPQAILSQYFPNISLFQAIILVSVIPFIIGIYIVYQALFQLKNTRAFLLISLAISTSLLSWFRLIQFRLSLLFLGVILTILFAMFYDDLKAYLSKTKFTKKKQWIAPLFILLLLPTMVLPAVVSALQVPTPTESEIAAFSWLKEHTPPQSGVLARLEEGYLVTYFARRRNVMDERFGTVRDVGTRLADTNTLYHTTLQTIALDLLDKYNIQYIILTSHAQQTAGISSLPYLSKKCFELVYHESDQQGDGVRIYRVRCTVGELRT